MHAFLAVSEALESHGDQRARVYAIHRSCLNKSKIVEADEKENGIRAILNFGHTFGHAIEAHNNFKDITHGAAITLGMVIASKLSFFEGHIKQIYGFLKAQQSKYTVF